MIKVLYHNDADGFCAAWVFRMKFPNAIYIPVNYGQVAPNMNLNDEIYIVDFSYPREVLETMKVNVKSLVVLDHHETAEAELAGLDYCIFDMTKAGCRLAWEYCFPGDDYPMLVLYCEDYDLWKFDLIHSRLVNLAIQSIPRTFAAWDTLHRDWSTKNLRDRGEGIDSFIANYIIAKHTTDAVMAEWEGHTVPIVNATVCISLTHDMLLKYNYPFTITYQDKEGLRTYNLRSRGKVNVAAIAKKYGGVGHANAAGFTVKLEGTQLPCIAKTHSH